MGRCRGGPTCGAEGARRAIDAALAAAVRRSLLPHGLLDQLQCDRADVLLACGVRLGDARLLATARQVLDALSGGPASARDPLVRVRVQSLRAVAHARLGLAQDRIEDIAGAVELLVATLDGLRPEHSPLDWARLQRDLAITLQSLGEHSQTDRAFEHALSCYGRALWITREQPILALHAALAQDQAACLAQRARLAAEPGMLDAAVETLRRGLAALDPARDPVGWAIAQVNLAQLYLARLDLTGREADRASAGLALAGALDVFAEHGLRSMVDQANASLDRLRGWPASGVSS
jgi:tetratricopeptide (TPR) repeat protein